MTSRLSPGEIFEQRYRIERHVCDGAMGSIYQAVHLNLEIPVAIKVARMGIGDAAEIEDRFLREARAAAHVRNEHVAQVLDSGRSQRGDAYMVLEFLSGFDLAAADLGPQLTIAAAVECAVQVCRGMSVAHARGVVHRDLKPSNLFVTSDVRGRPLIKILDFGISRVEGARPGVITNSGNLIGSPCYVSPEQARDSKSADARSDIWSLGVVLYELLTGQLPFDGDEVGQVLSRVLTEEPLPPSRLRHDIPAGLERIVLACLNKTPASRPQSMTQLADLLVPYAVGEVSINQRSDAVKGSESVLPQSSRPLSSAPPQSAASQTRRASGLPPPKPRIQSEPPRSNRASDAGVAADSIPKPPKLPASIEETVSASRWRNSPSSSRRNLEGTMPGKSVPGMIKSVTLPSSSVPRDTNGRTWVLLTAAAVIGIAIGILRLQADDGGRVSERRIFAAAPMLDVSKASAVGETVGDATSSLSAPAISSLGATQRAEGAGAATLKLTEQSLSEAKVPAGVAANAASSAVSSPEEFVGVQPVIPAVNPSALSADVNSPPVNPMPKSVAETGNLSVPQHVAPLTSIQPNGGPPSGAHLRVNPEVAVIAGNAPLPNNANAVLAASAASLTQANRVSSAVLPVRSTPY